MKMCGNARHAALHTARAPAPGDPQPAALLGGAKASLRIAVEFDDKGKALQRGERQQRRRLMVKLAVDLGPVLRTQIGGDIGEIAQRGGDGHEGTRAVETTQQNCRRFQRVDTGMASSPVGA